MTFTLVLSAGGSRTVAQLGAIRALDDAGLHPGGVAGCSGGALIAAVVATGMSYQKRVGLMHAMRTVTPWRDFAPWRGSLFNGRALDDVLKKFFEERRVQDTHLPLRIVCTRLPRATEVIAEGLIWRAVRASLALPLLWPAVPWCNRRLVDGGLFEPVPVDAARTSLGGPILAIDVTAIRPGPVRRLVCNKPVFRHEDLHMQLDVDDLPWTGMDGDTINKALTRGEKLSRQVLCETPAWFKAPAQS